MRNQIYLHTRKVRLQRKRQEPERHINADKTQRIMHKEKYRIK